MNLPLGIYEKLITEAVENVLAHLNENEFVVTRQDIPEADLPSLIAHHVYVLILRKLKSHGPNSSKDDVIGEINGIIRSVSGPREMIVPGAELLQEIATKTALSIPGPTARPDLPFRKTDLLVNGSRDGQIFREINREIPSANHIDLLCAFIRHSGIRLFSEALQAQINSGASVRVITSVYTGTTERRALDLLVKMGARVKISYDTKQTRLHAKAWLFQRETGFDTAYIGSSNLTHWAQTDGLEWNVRISAIDNPDVISRYKAAFEQYWSEQAFEDYDPTEDARRLDSALSRDSGPSADLALVDLNPYPHQEMALEAIEAERQKGHTKTLVVAATGTGKTCIAAFDFRNLRLKNSHTTLLFVAHRKEILEQSQQTFRHALHDKSFGELLVDGKTPRKGHHVFASIQSLQSRIESLDPAGYDVIIVDEFHHAAAKSYEALLKRMRPKYLLGLTATPERADGKPTLEWFDGRLPTYESRLWDALDQGLLCPFHYFGIGEDVDLTTITFKRGRYDPGELDNIYTGDHIRVMNIHRTVQELITDPAKMKALGFCAGVKHARFMAREFQKLGYQAKSLDANTSSQERRDACHDLQNGKLNILFVVDLFNEGVDLPQVDTLLLLRPTESATVFTQQLGRGLRHYKGKHLLTVLDFIGQARKEYRFETRFRSLIGGTRKQISDSIENNFPQLPSGCMISLDKLSKDHVLKNLKRAIKHNRTHLVEELRSLGPDVRLHEFLEKTDFELNDIYANPGSGLCFSQLRHLAGSTSVNYSPESHAIFSNIGRLLHVNDSERIEAWRTLISPKYSNQNFGDKRSKRLALMLFSLVGQAKEEIGKTDDLVQKIRTNPDLKEEILDLLSILEDYSKIVPKPLYTRDAIPISSHAAYSSLEISAAFKVTSSQGVLHRIREGVRFDKGSRTDLLFVTLEKSEKDFAPSHMYNDYPISLSQFHWMSQNSAAPSTPVGQRYINRSSKVVLFVRQHKKLNGITQCYHCLGYARYQSHRSERPMKIIWDLERPMPGWIFQEGKVVAG